MISSLPRPRLGIDPGRALLALGLASSLWIVVQNEQNPDRTDVPNFTVPVEVSGLPSGLVAVSESPQIQVRVRMPSESFAQLRPGSFRATANAGSAGPGVNELPVQVEALEQRVRAVDSIPPQINVAFEEVTERAAPVRLNIVGNVPFGYAYTTPRIAPEVVTIIGPASAVQRVETAVVDIRLDGLTVSLNATYAPRAIDARGGDVRNVRVNPSTVNVEVPVEQQVGYKQVGIRPTVRGRVAAGYYLQPVEVEPASVTLVGPPAQLAAANFAETEPIDASGLSSGVVRRAQVVAPVGLSLLQGDPVSVTLRVTPVTATQAIRITPTMANLPVGMQQVGDVPQVDVTLSGPAPTLQALRPGDFRVALDLAGLGAGRHELEPRVTVPAGFTMDLVNPPRVTIELRALATPTPILAPTPAATPSDGAPPGPTPSG